MAFSERDVFLVVAKGKGSLCLLSLSDWGWDSRYGLYGAPQWDSNFCVLLWIAAQDLVGKREKEFIKLWEHGVGLRNACGESSEQSVKYPSLWAQSTELPHIGLCLHAPRSCFINSFILLYQQIHVLHLTAHAFVCMGKLLHLPAKYSYTTLWTQE